MGDDLATSSTHEYDEADKQTQEKNPTTATPSWEKLFGFTRRNHVPFLLIAIIGALVAAAAMPAFAVVYGFVFRDYTDFGAGKTDSDTFLGNVTRNCIILTGIVASNWIGNSFYHVFILTFGELQAKSAREHIFDALLKKTISWYDTQESSIIAKLPTIQM